MQYLATNSSTTNELTERNTDTCTDRHRHTETQRRILDCEVVFLGSTAHLQQPRARHGNVLCEQWHIVEFVVQPILQSKAVQYTQQAHRSTIEYSQSPSYTFPTFPFSFLSEIDEASCDPLPQPHLFPPPRALYRPSGQRLSPAHKRRGPTSCWCS